MEFNIIFTILIGIFFAGYFLYQKWIEKKLEIMIEQRVAAATLKALDDANKLAEMRVNKSVSEASQLASSNTLSSVRNELAYVRSEANDAIVYLNSVLRSNKEQDKAISKTAKDAVELLAKAERIINEAPVYKEAAANEASLKRMMKNIATSEIEDKVKSNARRNSNSGCVGFPN
jgi:hypothetical protein